MAPDSVPICSPLASAIAIVIVLLLPGTIITVLTHSEIAAIINPVLCVFPLVYLTVAADYSFPLIIDRELGAMESLLLYCKTVHRQWFRAFGLLVVIGLITKACDDDTRNLLLLGSPQVRQPSRLSQRVERESVRSSAAVRALPRQRGTPNLRRASKAKSV